VPVRRAVSARIFLTFSTERTRPGLHRPKASHVASVAQLGSRVHLGRASLGRPEGGPRGWRATPRPSAPKSQPSQPLASATASRSVRHDRWSQMHKRAVVGNLAFSANARSAVIVAPAVPAFDHQTVVDDRAHGPREAAHLFCGYADARNADEAPPRSRRSRTPCQSKDSLVAAGCEPRAPARHRGSPPPSSCRGRWPW
jgi:hypothetical protein